MTTIRITNQTHAHAEKILRNLPHDGSMEIVVRPHKNTRSVQQNRLLWSMLGEISEQVNWHGNKLTAENWKDVLTAAIKKQTVMPGIDGGFVVCGTSTSRMTIKEMNELIDLMEAFGTQQGVRFSSDREE